MTSAMPSASEKVEINKYPFWSPRFWHGMRTACWWSLLAKNGFRITPSRLPIALGVSLFTPVNDLLWLAQKLIYGRKIERILLTKPPIFILGHWRSGTTLLHELLVTDPQFASPSTYQCFAPSHFILSEWMMVRFGGFLLPKRRPMDNMQAGWQLPQEDEFALMNLGVPTPYLRIAFPRTQDACLEYLSLSNLDEPQLQHWRDKLLWFIRALTYHHRGKQLVLKSPPHTGRIAELTRLFPGAKFVHLTREPRTLFASTMRLWKSLYEVQALQRTPSDSEMRSYVSECLSRMYHEFELARDIIPAECLVDVRYEDLVADPSATLRGLYQELSLGDFSLVEPLLNERLENHKSYRTNAHRVDLASEEETLMHWGKYSEKYGY